MTDLKQKLKQLAVLKGIDASYLSAFGHSVEAEPEALIAISNALGGAQLDAKLAHFNRVIKTETKKALRQAAEPVWVLWDGEPLKFTLRVPNDDRSFSIPLRLRLESGEEKTVSVHLKDGVEVGVSGAGDAEKMGVRELEFSLKLKLPFGYHEAFFEIAGCKQKVLIISAPAKAYQKRGRGRPLGVFAPLYSLHSKDSLAMGDFSDLARFSQWAMERGCDFVGTLPMLAVFTGKPLTEPSPYSPVSRLHWNEMYLDPRQAPGWDSCASAQKLMASAGFQKKLKALSSAELLDYQKIALLKRSVFELLAEHFFSSNLARSAEYREFFKRNPTVEDYAEFRAVCEKRNQGWRKWPERLRDGKIQKGDYRESDKLYHVFAQYCAHLQLSALARTSKEAGLGVYIDFPLSVHSDGYDVWRERDSFVLGATAGAPADPTFVHGQDWSILPLHPHGIRANGYRYVRRSLENHMKHAGLLRLDHVMGFYRLFWVPSGLGAKKGVYVRYRWEEFFALLVLESHRNQCVLIGEDLGTVPPEIRSAMERHGILRMSIQQFHIHPKKSDLFTAIPEDSIVSLNTHDIPPFASFWKGADLDDQLKLKYFAKAELPKRKRERLLAKKNLLETLVRERALRSGERAPLKEVLRAILVRTAKLPVAVMQINLEDLWLETLPQNTPGTWKERPNWRRKTRLSWEQIMKNQFINDVLREVSENRHRSVSK